MTRTNKEFQRENTEFKIQKALDDFDKEIHPTDRNDNWNLLPYTKEPMDCNHCGRKTLMKAICEKRIVDTLYDRETPVSSMWTRWLILKCPLCDEINVYEAYSIADEDDVVVENGEIITAPDGEPLVREVIHIRPLYPIIDPSIPEPHINMPISILEDYQEAKKVYLISARSAAALLRLAIQKLCVFLGEKGKNIDGDIASLVRKGLPIHIQQALDIVRVIGNEAVHPGEIDIRDNPEIAKQLFSLVNEVVEDRIGSSEKQAKIGEIYKKLPASKLESIEKRDKVFKAKSDN